MHIISATSNTQTVDQITSANMAASPEELTSLSDQTSPSDTTVQSSDAFDGSAAPTMFMANNRMPVMIEFNTAVIYIVFGSLLLALLAILPGIRRTRFTSVLTIATILLVGASILVSIQSNHWITGTTQLYDVPYGASPGETISGELTVNIGLFSTNVSLYGQVSRSTRIKGKNVTLINQADWVDYNEQFHWDKPDRVSLEHFQALRKGLPFPILTISEFLSQDSDGFNWTRQLRVAGYFTSLTLYVALASWCCTLVIICSLPIYLPHMLQVNGTLLMLAVWVYTLLIQSPKAFAIRLGAADAIEFSFGQTYAVVFASGAISILAGVLLFVVQMNRSSTSDEPTETTIMDSQFYLKNQSALKLDNKALGLFRFPAKNREFLARNSTSPSVMIPIEDIAQKFKA